MAIKLNPNINLRHHSAHPQSSVRPNLDINPKPNFVEKASIGVNPSLTPQVGVEAVNSRKNNEEIDLDDLDPDEDSDQEDGEDRKCVCSQN